MKEFKLEASINLKDFNEFKKPNIFDYISNYLYSLLIKLDKNFNDRKPTFYYKILYFFGIRSKFNITYHNQIKKMVDEIRDFEDKHILELMINKETK